MRRTAVMNQIRGLLLERGITLPGATPYRCGLQIFRHFGFRRRCERDLATQVMHQQVLFDCLQRMLSNRRVYGAIRAN